MKMQVFLLSSVRINEISILTLVKHRELKEAGRSFISIFQEGSAFRLSVMERKSKRSKYEIIYLIQEAGSIAT